MVGDRGEAGWRASDVALGLRRTSVLVHDRRQPPGSILGVWAHPDDETWLCAGLMARAAAAGDRSSASRRPAASSAPPTRSAGRAAPRWPPYAPRRWRALAILGVTEHHWLDYPDGGCADVDQDEAVRRVTAVMQDVQPDTVLTFGPDGMTGHDDHKAACRWATAAFEAAASGGRRWATRRTRLSGSRSSASRSTGSTCSWAPSRRARHGTSSCSASCSRASGWRPSWPRSPR
jgi:hypothetical protein